MKYVLYLLYFICFTECICYTYAWKSQLNSSAHVTVNFWFFYLVALDKVLLIQTNSLGFKTLHCRKIYIFPHCCCFTKDCRDLAPPDQCFQITTVIGAGCTLYPESCRLSCGQCKLCPEPDEIPPCSLGMMIINVYSSFDIVQTHLTGMLHGHSYGLFQWFLIVLFFCTH